MARALIVGGGARGDELADVLAGEGWAVRRTVEAGAGDSAGPVERVVADPASLGSVVDAIEGVAVIAWLLGDESDPARSRVNSELFGRLLEEIVDTPVRGVAYEAWGAGEAAVEAAEGAAATWRIRTAAIAESPGDVWLTAALAAVGAALG